MHFNFVWLNYFLATVLFALYLLFVMNVERKEFAQIPVLKKFLKKTHSE